MKSSANNCSVSVAGWPSCWLPTECVRRRGPTLPPKMDSVVGLTFIHWRKVVAIVALLLFSMGKKWSSVMRRVGRILVAVVCRVSVLVVGSLFKHDNRIKDRLNPYHLADPLLQRAGGDVHEFLCVAVDVSVSLLVLHLLTRRRYRWAGKVSFCLPSFLHQSFLYLNLCPLHFPIWG